jgi:hypothetical protein
VARSELQMQSPRILKSPSVVKYGMPLPSLTARIPRSAHPRNLVLRWSHRQHLQMRIVWRAEAPGVSSLSWQMTL